ncbi:hypothetical protein GCM10023172_21130 [Hymenobacter ginsengisoli]|uniref:DUF4249 domain-containing protein n=1 Tax=Hymenobacter ginsengisoli TaxID=1051626 RepID=A0ABP8QD80_9BACT|nr:MULTISPECIES: DUF4249 domain-containing protein [unclassified Hymenobacter]MBO2032119.1 DUF4249 domain-containing protein [Hymenobacter sp. BT559]
MSRPSAFLLRWGGRLLLLALAGCVEPYVPAVLDAPARYLVVDGFINGAGRTRITLSRTQNISTASAPPAEKGAKITIVDEKGGSYALTEQRPGFYVSDSLLLPTGRRYQLRISTGAGVGAATSYESDLVPLKVTPPIDKLEWMRQDGQLQFRFSTHDPSGGSRFYRWRASETWEFTALYQSNLEFRGGIIQNRITPIYTCWHTEQPSTITQTSTASLSQDALTEQQVLSFSERAERVKIRYSLLLTQYAETAEEFAYNEILRKNTEAVGTVNDPLPSQLTGNVHRVGSPQEPVLGFVGAHTLQSRRIFISRQDLPAHPPDFFENPYAACQEPDTAEIVKPYNKNGMLYPKSSVFADPDNVPTDYAYGPSYGYPIMGYIGGARECIDCRVRGSNTKPAYW